LPWNGALRGAIGELRPESLTSVDKRILAHLSLIIPDLADHLGNSFERSEGGLGFCGPEHLRSGGSRFFGDLNTAEHAGDFFVLFGIAQRFDLAARSTLGHRFLNEEMRVGENRDLRQMGNTDDLVVAGDLLELSTDHFGDRAADAGVYLVKDIKSSRS